MQLIIKDDQQNPDIGRKAAEDLIKEDVAAIIGPMTSDMGMVIAPILNKVRLLNVSPTVTTQHLTGIDDYFFRVTSSAHAHATLSARYQIDSGDMRRVAAAYDKGNSSFTESWLKSFESLFIAEGGKIVATVAFNTKEKRSFSDIAGELLGHKS